LLEAREVPHVTGTVFVDLNLNGIQDVEDVGAQGVAVTATPDSGAPETVTTAADGSFELITDSDNLRIEFSGFPEGTMPGRVAGTSGPVVRFLTAASDRTSVDLALASPILVTTQFYYDHAIDGLNSGEGAILTAPYGDESGATPTVLATVAQVGSVWGLAYQPSSNSIYAASFVKRHAGVGPDGTGLATTTGGIYRINRAADPIEVSLLIDLNTTGFSAGPDPHPSQEEFDGGDWFHDSETMPLVGKRGLGGLQISPDGRTLYVMNLSSRQLIEIPLSADGTRDTATRSLRGTTIPLDDPAGSGISGFNSDDMRPFAVAVRGNAVFVGVTYTAESGSQTRSNLRAFVYAYDPAQTAFRAYDQSTGIFATSGPAVPVLVADLTYARGIADDPDETIDGDEVSADWQRWTDAFDAGAGQADVPVHPEPWLTDIEFDGDAMVLAFRDRFGDQGGFQTGNAAAGDTPFSVIAAGDILRATPNGAGGWQLESNGLSGAVTTVGVGNGEGPGGGEFYFGDNVNPFPDEVITGGLAQVPGFNTVAATGNDPTSAFAGGIYTFFNSDTDPGAANTAGTVFARTSIYESIDLNTFGSSNGLGDLEAVAAVGAVQAGDRLFTDTNGNGLQDPGEPGIPGVTVQLFQSGAAVDSVVTGPGGDFLFDDLAPNTSYEVRIDTTQTPLANTTLAPANQGSNDQLDSDATLNGSHAVIAFTTGAEGTTDTSLDGGFTILQTGPLTLGNLVFRDNNNNGTFDTGDIGISGVVLELLDSSGNPISGNPTATTDSNGIYSFTG
jgi:hypothetical protein